MVLASDQQRFERRLDALVRQETPFAIAVALTKTAKDAQAEVERRMPVLLDKPTTFTKRGVGISPARKARPVAQVFVKRIQAQYLRIQSTGGVRKPRKKVLIHPAGIRKNKFGNIPRTAVGRAMARSDTFVASGRDPRASHLSPGIYQRGKYRKRGAGRGRGFVKLLIAFDDAQTYQRRFPFDQITIDVGRRVFRDRFRNELRRAVFKATRIK